MHQSGLETTLDAGERLACEWRLFERAEAGADAGACLIWEAARPVVVLGHGRPGGGGRPRGLPPGRRPCAAPAVRGRRPVLHHGTLLYDFDPALATRYLREPARRPAYRGMRPHTEFMGNLPLPAAEVPASLTAAWEALAR